ncbi:MAG: hypothetical protein IPL28_26280 [Chloroflexi bacterium]|nr:hypothetical protein [Chloroflexota bacterium]
MTITTTKQRDGTWTAATLYNGKPAMVCACATEEEAVAMLKSLIAHLEKQKHEQR